MAMKRVLFHIPQDQNERLHAMAAQRQISTGELVRRFIDQGLARLEAPKESTEARILADVQQQVTELRVVLEALQSRIENELGIR